MRAWQSGRGGSIWPLLSAPCALAGLCGALAAVAVAQDTGAPDLPDTSVAADPPAPAGPPPGPLKVMSWNVASSPYAIAMRQIKTSTKTWRTSFGSERRTIEAPERPEASSFDVDVVLLQGITNPRAMRRLFPPRTWRLIFSRRALQSLPKGSVFTAPVSSVEVEAVAIRFRDGMRITNRADDIDGNDAASPDKTAPAAAASQDAAEPPTSNSAGLAVKVVDRGQTYWFASASIGADCETAQIPCEKSRLLARWRADTRKDGETLVVGGRLLPGKESAPCDKQTVEADTQGANALPPQGKGKHSDLFGCAAELTLD